MPVAVFLHKGDNQNSDEFCRNTLTSPSLVKYLNGKYILWVGKPDSEVEAFVKTFFSPQNKSEMWPFLMICAVLAGSTVSILDVIQGKKGVALILVEVIKIISRAY
jgi:hypothetical protein